MFAYHGLYRLIVFVALIVAAIAACSDEGDEPAEPAGQVAQAVEAPAQQEREQQSQQVAAQSQERAQEQDQAQAQEQAEAAPNQPPVADAGEDLRLSLQAGEAALSARGSSDPDGDRLSYEWLQVDGEPVELRHDGSSSIRATFAKPAAEGRLTFRLRVTDEHGASAADTVTVVLVDEPPIADAGRNRDVQRGDVVTLDAGGSSDPEDGTLSVSWVQAGGPPVELSDPNAYQPTFIAPDEYGALRFTLTVHDGNSASEPDTVVITIRNTLPTAVAGPPQEVGIGSSVTLDAGQSSDPDGDPLVFEWSQRSGDPVDLRGADTAQPTFTAPDRAQRLSFRVEVSDGDLTSSATVTVTVEYEPVIASNFDSATSRTTRFYEAEADAFTGNVRTDVRLIGPNDDLMLDAVCFPSGTAAIGFRLLGFERAERDASFPDQLTVMWRVDDGPVIERTLDVEFLGDQPAVYLQGGIAGTGFSADWPDLFGGGSLVVRIGYRGVQEDVFDLDRFAGTPVHGNLVNCGAY